MRAAVVLGVLAVALVGCGGSSQKQPPPLGRGQSLQPVAVYEAVDATHPARHVRTIRMAIPSYTGAILHERVDRKPLFVLHATAAEVVRGVVRLYAPEAANFYQYQQEVGGGTFVGLFGGVGYDVGSVVGDPDGLDIFLRVGPDEPVAASIADKLTTRVRVVDPPTPL